MTSDLDRTFSITAHVLKQWKQIAKDDHAALAKYDRGKTGPCLIVLDIDSILKRKKA